MWFHCYDYSDNIVKTCYNYWTGYYVCTDGTEWEHANWNEHDGTWDNSLLTSIATDGQAWTSPSVKEDLSATESLQETSKSTNVRTYVTASSLEESSENTSVDEPPKVQNYYCGTVINLPYG